MEQLEDSVKDYWGIADAPPGSLAVPMPMKAATRSPLEAMPPRTLPAFPMNRHREPQPWYVPIAMTGIPSVCMMIVGLAWISSQGSGDSMARAAMEANTAIAIAAAKRPISNTCILAWQCPNSGTEQAGEVQKIEGQNFQVSTVSAPIDSNIPMVTIIAPANVRSAPSLTAQSVGVLPSGATVAIANQPRVMSEGIEWVPTVPGWIASTLVQ